MVGLPPHKNEQKTPPPDVIALDIGNSNVTAALFSQGKLQHTDHVPVGDLDKLPDILSALRSLCPPQPLGAHTVPVVAGSVNTPALARVEQIVIQLFQQNILLVGRDVPLLMKVAVENPEKLGSDRLLTAQAAYEVIKGPLVVADFGTAVTIDLVNANGIFLGGAIFPGLALSSLALNEHTSQLPIVDIKIPDHPYGTNTEKAIQTGIAFGAVGALREIVERYATELGTWPQLVVTGGYARLIAQMCDFIDSVVPDLCVNGIYLAYLDFRAQQDMPEPSDTDG